MSSSTPAVSTRWLGLGLGVVLLALMAGFAIGLPRIADDPPAAELADTLPGGWTALELATAPDGADDAAYDKQQRQALAYVNTVLGKVYEEPTQFRAYVNKAGDALVTITLFHATGGAFAPANGVADPDLFGLDRAPVELTRVGNAVCIANYQSAAQSSGEDVASAAPLSVSCQAPHGGETLQIGSQDMSVADTVTLLRASAAQLG